MLPRPNGNLREQLKKPLKQLDAKDCRIQFYTHCRRSICSLSSHSHFQPLFLPAAITDGAGRELATVTALGAFLAASVFAEEDPSVAEKHFSGKQNSAAGNAMLLSECRLLWPIIVQLIQPDNCGNSDSGWSDNRLEWQYLQSPNCLSYDDNGMVRVTVVYSDTFDNIPWCHCNCSTLYLHTVGSKLQFFSKTK